MLISFANQKNWKKRTVPVSSVKDLVPKLPWWLECNPQRCFSNVPPIFFMFCKCFKVCPGFLRGVFQTSLHNFMFYRCSKISPGSKEFYAYVIFHVLKVSLKDVSRFPYWRGWPDPRNVQLLEAMEAKNISGDFNVTKILTKSSSIYH